MYSNLRSGAWRYHVIKDQTREYLVVNPSSTVFQFIIQRKFNLIHSIRIWNGLFNLFCFISHKFLEFWCLLDLIRMNRVVDIDNEYKCEFDSRILIKSFKPKIQFRQKTLKY